MDLDIEMGESMETHQAEPVTEIPLGDDILQPDEPEEDGEVADDAPPAENDDSKIIIPNKLHIHGLDTLHTDDIKSYIKAHYGPVDKIEWIDDSSANLVFGSEPSARDALTALSTIEIADATALAVGETLPAKPVEGKPEITLKVRWGVASDKKVAGAALRSRYYLLHPEHDPEERRRRQQESRSRYRDRDGDRGGGRRRRDSDEGIQYDASMYDDVPRPARRRRDSDERDRSRSYANENRGKELFASRASGRDRSASPQHRRDDDGDIDVDDPASSSRNRTRARSLRDRISVNNSSKELFPSRSSGRGGRLDQLEKAIGSAQLREEDMPKMAVVPGASSTRDGAFNIRGLASERQGDDAGFAIKGAASARELFPGKFGGGSNTGKELLDSSRSKQRQKAQDLFS